MNKFLLIIGFLLLLTSCGTVPLTECSKSPVKFDETKIQFYTAEKSQSEILEAPYISTFIKDEMVLKFVAADHSNSIESPTFKTVKDVIENSGPKLLILEGFEDQGRVSDPSYIQHAEKCHSELYRSCGEPSYSAYLANKKGLPFISGDPSDPDILPSIQQKGYSADDLIGLRLIQLIPQWRRAKELDSKTTPKRLEKRAAWLARELNSKNVYTFNSLRAWYKSKTSNEFDFGSIGTMTVAPIMDGSGTELNKISASVSIARNTFLLKKIESALNIYKNVVVVFGQGHLVQLRPALEATLGPSKNEKTF